MAGLAPDRTRSAEVRKLAADIKKAQAPEIETLSGWLTSWGETVPSESATDHSTHGTHGTHGMDGMDGMDGMMTGDDVDTLEKATGTAFDTAFLQMMIKHHEGAVDMARTEQAHGAYAPVKKMAGRIITSRSAETEQMNRLLGKS